MHLEIVLLSVSSLLSYALDNGLALTPPMGWLSWERFPCNTDCKNDPKNCISEKLYMDMADRLAADGFKEAGYEYVNIDDCWMDTKRDENGKLRADPVRFKSGIKALADYVHSKGLKLGIYSDCGPKTCAGYPGSYEHYDTDAKTFADWGVDMLKMDGCHASTLDIDSLYPQITTALNNTGRPIVFSCSWPAYESNPNYTAIAENCNLWRNYFDIEDSWLSVLTIVDYYAAHQDELAAVAGPGHWNDPDMIIGGNFGLSYEEAKAQMVLWAIMASPLLMSNDLRSLDKEYKDLFTNKEIIAVNQDPLGIMGKRICNDGKTEVWKRPISPVNDNNDYSYALVFFNRRTLGGPLKTSSMLNLSSKDCYEVYDVFNVDDKKICCPEDSIDVTVNPSGVAMFIAKALHSGIVNQTVN